MQSALVRKDAVMLHDPMRTHSRATMVGVVLAAVGVLGFVIVGLLSPAPTVPDSGIIIAEPSGTVYVVSGNPKTLTPTFNLASARLLLLAQETADRLTEEARTESEKVLADAKSHSEAMVSDATTRAEAAERDSRIKAEALDAEAKARYDEVLGNLASERVGLEKKIEDLRTYEKEYRGRLKSWISDQLAQLDGDANREKATAVVSDPA
jgi:hypothetical protein